MKVSYMREKNDFAEVLKNLVRHKFKNNFVGLSKQTLSSK